VSDIAPADVYGTVLRRTSAEDGAVVVLRLGGPEEPEMTGTVDLSPRLLHDIMNGDLELLTHTSRGFDHRSLIARDRP